jgi:uncharacterized protein
VESGHDFLVMAKPGGARCNLACGYCYYLPKAELFRQAPGRMGPELLERYIAERLEASPGPVTHFEWHGGEPTLLGLEYFRSIARLQARLGPPGRRITNGLQTNGLLLNEAWAEFLRREAWSVGLSLDGPADLHDAYRRGADGKRTHERVMRSYETLKRHGVFTNLLCVLHEANASKPDEVYAFFRDIGARYLQFLPLVTPARPVAPERADEQGRQAGAAHPAAASPEAIGEFLCRVFDLWLAQDVGRIVVQAFDEALRPAYGLPHALCVHRETCGDAPALERDGGLYACDHFVDPENLIGNILERSLSSLADDPRLRSFGLTKRKSLPRVCKECEVLAYCNGGCPKDRIATAPDGEAGLNYLCPAYKRFFAHSKPELERLATHMKARRKLREFGREERR